MAFIIYIHFKQLNTVSGEVKEVVQQDYVSVIWLCQDVVISIVQKKDQFASHRHFDCCRISSWSFNLWFNTFFKNLNAKKTATFYNKCNCSCFKQNKSYLKILKIKRIKKLFFSKNE
jgi:hypothetical protein